MEHVYPSRASLSEMNVREIREEIDRTLSDIDVTLDALKAAASPQAIKAKAVAQVKERAANVWAGVLNSLRANPLPAIAATLAIGGGMVMLRRRRARLALPPPSPLRELEQRVEAWLRS